MKRLPRRWATAAVHAVSALGLLMPVALAGGGDNRGDDDMGTLPSMAQPPIGLVAYGTNQELAAVIPNWEGRGVVLEDLGDGTTKLTVIGDATVYVDLTALAKSDVDVRLAVGAEYAGGTAAYQVGGAWSGPFTLGPLGRPGEVDVPLTAIAGLGEPVMFGALSPLRGRYSLRLQASGEMLILGQRLD